MAKQEQDFFKTLLKELRDLWLAFRNEMRISTASIRNRLRTMRQPRIDYVVLTLSGSLPERDEPPRSFVERQLPFRGKQPLSVETLTRALRRIEEADNAHGVLLVLQGVNGGMATLQTVHQELMRLRKANKRVAVYTPFLTTAHYFIATAADTVIIPPSTNFDVMGFYNEASFYTGFLDKLGIEMHGFQISPYKTGVDPLTKREPTPEYAEMTNWLLDERYEMLVSTIAEGRNLAEEKIRELIDEAPLFAEQALANGLVDHLGYEDELEEILSGNGRPAPTDDSTSEATETDDEKKINLLRWPKAAPFLTTHPKKRHRKYIGVVSLEGAIMRGNSQDPPIDLPIPIVGGQTAGHETLTAVLRQAEKDEQLAALIFHVNSPGGDSLASDLIGREIERISKRIPVVVYMGDVAASGGYYVSATAQHIICQSGTITGSIGVFMLKPSLEELNEKLDINQFEFKRGQNAGLYMSTQAPSQSQKAQLKAGVEETYRQFKTIVSRGRDIPYEELDPICNGRVWTGRQALDRKLVDSLGSFQDAVKVAINLAELPQKPDIEIEVTNIHGKKAEYSLPKPMETAAYLTSLLSQEQLNHIVNRPLLFMPYKFDL